MSVSYDSWWNLFNKHRSMMVIVEPKTGKIKHANHSALMFYGYKPEEIKMLSIFDITFSASGREVKELRNDRSTRYQFKHMTKDGTIKNVEIFSGPIFLKDEKNYLYIIHSVDEIVKLKEEIQESKTVFQMVLKGAGEGYWDWDIVNDKIKYHNEWNRILGYSSKEVKPSIEERKKLMHPDDKKIWVETLNKHLNGKTDYFQVIYRSLNKKGNYLWIQDRGRVIERDENWNPLRAVGTHIDLTEIFNEDREGSYEVNFLKNGLSHFPAATALIDKNGKIIDKNVKFLNFLRKTVDFQAEDIFSIISKFGEEVYKKIKFDLETIFRSCKNVEIYNFNFKNMDIVLRYIPIFDIYGKIVVIITIFDILKNYKDDISIKKVLNLVDSPSYIRGKRGLKFINNCFASFFNIKNGDIEDNPLIYFLKIDSDYRERYLDIWEKNKERIEYRINFNDLFYKVEEILQFIDDDTVISKLSIIKE